MSAERQRLASEVQLSAALFRFCLTKLGQHSLPSLIAHVFHILASNDRLLEHCTCNISNAVVHTFLIPCALQLSKVRCISGRLVL